MDLKIKKVKNGYVLTVGGLEDYIANDEEEVGRLVVEVVKESMPIEPSKE